VIDFLRVNETGASSTRARSAAKTSSSQIMSLEKHGDNSPGFNLSISNIVESGGEVSKSILAKVSKAGVAVQKMFYYTLTTFDSCFALL
jgi:hypothetical protein